MKFSRPLAFAIWTLTDKALIILLFVTWMVMLENNFHGHFRIRRELLFCFSCKLFRFPCENFPIARKLSTRHLKRRCKLITRRNWQLNTLNTTNYGTRKAITHELTYNSVIRNFAIKYPWRGEIELRARGTANVSLQLTTKRVLGGEFNCKQSG